jgi:sterol 3beta-glucosyltransferase
MKAVIFSIGSRGDVEPYLAVAEILKAKSWEVICVFPEQYREMVENLGLSFCGFTKEYLELTFGNKDSKAFMTGRAKLNYFRMMRKRMKAIGAEMTALQHEVSHAEQPDRVIYHPKLSSSLVYGLKNPGKTILMCPTPAGPHRIKNLTVLKDLGKFMNTVANWLITRLRVKAMKGHFKRYQQDYPELVVTTSKIKKALLEEEKTIYAVSPSLFAKPEYWPDTAHVVGFYERQKTMDWSPNEELLDFLTRHEKVVFITFGSAVNTDPNEKTRIILESLNKNDIPAIISTGWGGIEEVDDPPEHVLFVKEMPYDWIFSRVYAVIHHGGAGTTHSALKYGCASLIIPHNGDMFFWDKTVSEQGAGPSGIPIKDFSLEAFEPKLLDLMTNDQYKQRAELIAEQMKTESDEEKLYELIAS